MKPNHIATALTCAALLTLSAPPLLAADEPVEPGAAGSLINDSFLTARVKTALAADKVTDALEIKVETTRGVVVLEGEVDSYAELTQATRVASSVDGVARVRNDLIGSAAANPDKSALARYFTDGALTTKVKSALVADPITEAIEIEVTTNRGVVSLEGVVDGVSEQMQATQVALSVDGVRNVDNRLEASGGPAGADPGAVGQHLSDAGLTARVKAALAIDMVAEASEIAVETNRGVVTLSGQVDSRKEAQQAIQVASSVEGVREVESQLTTN